MGIFDDNMDDDFDLEEIQARQDALEAELARELEEAEEAEEPAKEAGTKEAEAPVPVLDVTEVLKMEEESYPAGDWEAIIEAVLFTMGKPVELYQLAVAIDQDKKTAREAAERLRKRYDQENRGMEIIQLEDSYQMCTRGKYYENLIRVAAAPKKHMLTDVVLETLSIIAYKQPVTRLEIEKIRGVKSDHAVNRLIEYDLVQEVGRLDAPGRPALFATTDEFLRRFGIGSTANLPDMDPVKMEEIRSQVAEEMQMDLEQAEEESVEPYLEQLGEEPAEPDFGQTEEESGKRNEKEFE